MLANSDIKQIKILELGAGTGLVGLSWALKWKELYGTENIRNLRDGFTRDCDEFEEKCVIK